MAQAREADEDQNDAALDAAPAPAVESTADAPADSADEERPGDT